MKYALRSRVLHWLMAVAILSTAFIGFTMVTSLRDYHGLLAVHRPLGIAIFLLAIVRLVNRQVTPLPPFLATMSLRERRLASAGERSLYALMIAVPLVGWAMLSAGSFPIVLVGSIHLPPILPPSPPLYAALRSAHTVLACALVALFLGHLSAVLFHVLIVRDRILSRMSFSRNERTPE
jgi:cytochrome b561